MAFEKIFNGSPIDNKIISAASPQNPQLGVDIDADVLWVNSGNGWVQVSVSGGGGTFVNNEVPTGLVNGSNQVFTLAHSPAAGSATVYWNGVLQTPTTQYSISGNTITFVTAPTSGGILVNYRY